MTNDEFYNKLTQLERNELRSQIRNEIESYRTKYQNLVESKYPKLSKAQKQTLTSIMIADSLTQEQMRTDVVYSSFSYGGAQKVENEIILIQANSATLRTLENKGIIEIIIDARLNIDHVKLIK